MVEKAIARAERSAAKALKNLVTVDWYAIQDNPFEDNPHYIQRRLDAVVGGPKRRGPTGGRVDSRGINLFDRLKVRVGDYFIFNGNRLTVTEVESDFPDQPDGTQWMPNVTATRSAISSVMFGEPRYTIANGQRIRDDGSTFIFVCETFEFGGLRFPFTGNADDLFLIDVLADYSTGDQSVREGVEVSTWTAEYTLPYVGFAKRLTTEWNMWDQSRCVQLDITSVRPEFSSEVPTVTVATSYSRRRR